MGILGESGCGKTTLLKTILYRGRSMSAMVVTGKLDIGIIPKSDSKRSSTSKICIVMQNPLTALCPVLTIQDHFCDALDFLKKSDQKKHTLDWFTKVHLKDPEQFLERYPHELSGGEQQRVNIALSLCTQPEILLADEPTAALDPSVRQGILKLLKKLQAAHGFTLVYVSHDLGVLNFICNQLMVMHNGEIIERGSKNTIFKTPQHPYTQSLLKTYHS